MEDGKSTCQNKRDISSEKLFKHATQVRISKTKRGVDGATQNREILLSVTSGFKLHHKIV